MIIGHLGTEDRASTEAAWHGAKAYDWYGVGDTGSIAGEGPERDGMYVWEDAQYLELLDIDRRARRWLRGATGDMVVTCLYKDDIAPCIRFNTHDITHELDGRGEIVFKRIAGFKGRSDKHGQAARDQRFPPRDRRDHREPSRSYRRICLPPAPGRRAEGPHDRDARKPGRERSGRTGRTASAAGSGSEVEVALGRPRRDGSATEIDTRQKPLRLIEQARGVGGGDDPISGALEAANGPAQRLQRFRPLGRLWRGAAGGTDCSDLSRAISAVARDAVARGPRCFEMRLGTRDADVCRPAAAVGGRRSIGVLNMRKPRSAPRPTTPHFGAVQNPHRIGFSPGGSSGGSGAAVAAGLCDIALGTDTMGSVRIPASHCGVYGFKPATASVSQEGLEPADLSLDAIGPMARDLDTLERAARVISGFGDDALEGTGATLAEHGVEVQPDVARAFDAALAALGASPANVALSHPQSRIRFAGFIGVSRELAAHLRGVPTSERLAKLLTYGPRRSIADWAEDRTILERTAAEVRAVVEEHGFPDPAHRPQSGFSA